MSRHVIITGCSGGGKSTLLAELARRGFVVVPEPGRRIVREELEHGGTALPWTDMVSFARRAITMAYRDKAAVPETDDWVFFDRGLIDAAAALRHVAPASIPGLDGLLRDQRYHRRVFFAPPWPEIFAADPERRHGFDAAAAEHDRLLTAYCALDYEIIELPRNDVGSRADFVLGTLSNAL